MRGVVTTIDREIVEQEVSQMFDEHKTFQGVIEALLVETGWDATAIRAAEEARQKKQQIEKEKEAKQETKKQKKKSPQALIQQLAKEQKAERAEDEKSRSGSRRTLPLVIAVEKEVESDEESETEAEVEDEGPGGIRGKIMSEVNATQKQQSEADELKSLVDKFLASQGVATKSEDAKKADVPPSTNVLIGVPCFGGNIQYKTVNLLMSLSSSLSSAKIPHQTHFVAHESLITRARNYLASVATFSKDSAERPFSHLLFIDADISFHPEYVFKMLKANRPIIALPCARKSLDWKFIAEAAKRVPPESIPVFAGDPVFAFDSSSFAVDDKPVPIRAAGTGVMLISVEVFKAFVAAHPDRKYRAISRNPRHPDWNYDFFRTEILEDNFLSEDYAFCEESARLGFSTFLLPLAVTKHAGSFDYTMDMAAVGSLRAAIGRDVNAALKTNEPVEQPTN